ncbi:hypothetical protein IDSA_01045 [Pseudidiomarina salinarum]|uniref:Polysaccharide chain length determinant N-terminal domain-containing protein n=1 Tax=Pseudidiomarina salinarum TaxID=435908 RepID=A0A094IUL5_9GAMM|nr:Wzz/FepE/Etk N-terminal domain-containing protein [Pseudidiomarina salinarum]KFZ31345.1 hypothetical protein IDSA_01045 [Pseudidiomarina salinarum]RUO70896.1 hypothetical protein CWI79_05510 [Pseudidiomarina salinarum]
MSAETEFSLPSMLSYYWNHKWKVILFTLCLTALSILYALSEAELYESTVLVAPADKGGNHFSNLADSQIGSLAGLAGINIGTGSALNDIDLAFAILQSNKFLSKFINENNLKPILFAVDRWDPVRNDFIFDSELYLSDSGLWVGNAGERTEPTNQKAVKVLLEKIEIEEARYAGLYNISMRSRSPVTAKEWLDSLILSLNEELRLKDQEEAIQSIRFLEKKLSVVTSAEIKGVLYSLMEEQTKRLMLTEARKDYIIEIIDPPIYPDQRVHPKRSLIVLIGIILGLTISIFILTIRYFYICLEDK